MPSFELREYEANALIRALVEAKFHGTDVQDPEILTSPMIARCALELVAQARREDEARDGEAATVGWRRWLHCSPDRHEWRTAVANARETWKSAWSRWNDQERLEAVRFLFAPFDCASPEQFLREVEMGLGRTGDAG
jgi:hypothetical protein